LWIVGKNSFQYFVLPKRADIDAQARNVYQTLSDSTSSTRTNDKKSNTKKDFAAESLNLSQMLAIDKFANLPAKRLIFVADGALNSIPFASLSYQNKFIGEI
jgi:CHAT domain-containing protein